jgi:glutamine synthetase
MSRFTRFFALPLALLAATASHATAMEGNAAHFFSYRPVPGQQAKFEEGYRQHLDWHRQHHDPLVWYGWTIQDGPRQGMFVDASVGEPFGAFDQRVDPAGDGVNFHKTAAPYATAIQNSSYVLLRKLSSGFPLEQRQPSRVVQVIYYRLHPGGAAHFERALRVMRKVLASMPDAPAHTWYRLTVGGPPEYMLMIARDNWGSYDRFNHQVADLLDGNETALRDFAEAVSESESETWQYHAELSYLP